MKVKICGITDLTTAIAAIDYGANALGFVFAESKRKISETKAKDIISHLPKEIFKVGVFVNESKEKIEENVKEEETPVEIPAPSVTIPNNNTKNIPATNNNGNGNANPNAQKNEMNNQQDSGNSPSDKNIPGQQKNEVKKAEKQNASSVKKQEKTNNGNKEEKPRK